MFKLEHQMWKIIALVFCIKIPHTKTCYTFIHTHIKVIKFKGHFYFTFIFNTQCCNITLVPIHMPAIKYEKFKAISCLLKYVIIIENIIRHLVKKVLSQQKLRQKSVMEQPWSIVSIVEDKDIPRIFSKWSQSSM